MFVIYLRKLFTPVRQATRCSPRLIHAKAKNCFEKKCLWKSQIIAKKLFTSKKWLYPGFWVLNWSVSRKLCTIRLKCILQSCSACKVGSRSIYQNRIILHISIIYFLMKLAYFGEIDQLHQKVQGVPRRVYPVW